MSITKTSALVFWTLRKHTTGLFVKSFGKCCGCKVLTDACYWPSSKCFPAQTFRCVVSRKLNHNHSHVFDSHNGVCFLHSCSVYIRRGEPIYYHGPHEVFIVADGPQINQFCLLPLSNYEEEWLLFTYYLSICLSWSFVLARFCTFIRVTRILMWAISNVQAGRRFPAAGLFELGKH